MVWEVNTLSQTLRDQRLKVEETSALLGKVVAAICHAPWTLVEADVLRGRTLTSWPSLQTDIRNAGGEWKDDRVVVDGNLITSRNPDDLPPFIGAVLEAANHGVDYAKYADQ